MLKEKLGDFFPGLEDSPMDTLNIHYDFTGDLEKIKKGYVLSDTARLAVPPFFPVFILY